MKRRNFIKGVLLGALVPAAVVAEEKTKVRQGVGTLIYSDEEVVLGFGGICKEVPTRPVELYKRPRSQTLAESMEYEALEVECKLVDGEWNFVQRQQAHRYMPTKPMVLSG